ncbi:hypothetical protein [Acinetobacter baumannii]|uniref:hypothetical protein n=1 Tax=Acinetobacter baumannii TaxID=470 RepID=UPI0005FBEBD5|nr:hypothetical protein [Acinetobacter baumannii]
MTDLNKEREAFEQHLIDIGLVEFAGYGFDVNECDEYTHEPTNVAWGAWVIGLNRAKAQAVPEGYVLMPKVPTEKMFQAYERSSVAPMSTLSKTGYKAMVEAAGDQNENS